MGLGDYVVATQMRDVMSTLIRKEIQRERPRYEYATVKSVDRASRRAYVQFQGEEGEEQIALGHLIPGHEGQVVRVEGLTGDRYVADVMGAPALRAYSTYRGATGDFPTADLQADTWGLSVDDEGFYSTPVGVDEYRRQLVVGPDTIQTRQGRLGVTAPHPLYINPLFDYAVDDRINNRVQINNLVIGNWSQDSDLTGVIYHRNAESMTANQPGYNLAIQGTGATLLNTPVSNGILYLQVAQYSVMQISRPSFGRALMEEGQLYVKKATQTSWGEVGLVLEGTGVGSGAWSGMSAHVPDGANAPVWSVNHNVVAWNARNSSNNGWIPIKASAFTVSSSAREKSDIATLDEADVTARLHKLRPVSFKRPPSACPYCLGGDDSCETCHGGDIRGVGAKKYEDSPFLGFIAEEMEPVFPEACSYGPDGDVDGIDLGSLTAVLMKVVQKHDRAIAALQGGKK